SVDFVDTTTGTDLGSVGLVNGSDSLTVSTLAVGSHVITATYSGDSLSVASTSAGVTETVNPVTNLLDAITASSGPVRIHGATGADATPAAVAVNALPASQPPASTLSVQLSAPAQALKVGPVPLNPPPNLTLFIDGSPTPAGTVIDPAVPALVVHSGT